MPFTETSEKEAALESDIPQKSDTAKKKSKSFWGEVEKTQTTIEDFGYRVKTEIKKSDGSVVYIASNDADEMVAIKKITFPSDAQLQQTGFANGDTKSREGILQEISQRTRAEMEKLSQISKDSGNRFVITYYDYKIVQSEADYKYDLYIRMDYLTSLAQHWQDANVTVANLLNMGIDVCRALDWCHKNRQIHNNINPNNVFADKNGHFVLGDFALSYGEQNEMDYCIAPELVNGANPSSSSDIYSLGMILYTLLNDNLPPFAENNSKNELRNAETRRLKSELPSCPCKSNARLGEVILKALSPVQNRYQTVSDFQASLEHLLRSMPGDWLDRDINHCADPMPQMEDEQPDAPPLIPSVIEEPMDEPERVEPEEKQKRKADKKDLILIGTVVLVIAACIAAGMFFLSKAGNNEIYSLIDSKSYAVAFKEINEIHENGKNVDSLLDKYVESCMADYEYRRVIQSLPLYSGAKESNTEFYKGLVTQMINENKPAQAKSVLEFMQSKGGALKRASEEIYKEFQDKF